MVRWSRSPKKCLSRVAEYGVWDAIASLLLSPSRDLHEP